MPMRAAHPCGHHGCPNLVHGAGRFCDVHEKQAQAEYDSRRGGSAARGYGYRWQRLRRMVLASQPLCADPFGIHKEAGEVVVATDVDHIVAKSQGGDDSMDNLQGLCHECHSKKTVVMDGGYGRG